MERGIEFLRSQVNNAIAQHHSLVDSISAHADQADDARFRSLCVKALPLLQNHQRMLEDFGESIGADGASRITKTVGDMVSKARDAVDSLRDNDFLRLVSDTVMIRQGQDTFATFAAVGEAVGHPRLSDIGHECANDHDELQRDFNNLTRTLFIENVSGTPDQLKSTQPGAEARPL